MTLRHLPPVTIEGHRSSGAGTPDHPMRVATLRAAEINADGWTPDLRHNVERYFDDLAGEWHTRTSPERTAVVVARLPGKWQGTASRAGEGIWCVLQRD